MSLPVRSIRIAEADAANMELNLWKNRFVPASVQLNGINVPAKVRYRGGHTRGYPKRSYEVVSQGRTYHYNAEYDDPSLIRNALSFWFMREIGVPSPDTQHVLLIRNGRPLGIYVEIEAVDTRFFHRRGSSAKSLFYAVNDEADFRPPYPAEGLRGYEHRYGGRTERLRLQRFLRGIHRHRGEAAALYLRRTLDVSLYLKWLAGAVLTGNYDGFEQNYALYRHGRSGKWRVIPWDYEGTWGRNCYGRIVASDLVSVAGYNHLTRKLFNHRPFRQFYKTILQRLLDTVFTEGRIVAQASQLHQRIAPYYRNERLSQWPEVMFQGELEVIRRYVRERRQIVIAALAKW